MKNLLFEKVVWPSSNLLQNINIARKGKRLSNYQYSNDPKRCVVKLLYLSNGSLRQPSHRQLRKLNFQFQSAVQMSFRQQPGKLNLIIQNYTNNETNPSINIIFDISLYNRPRRPCNRFHKKSSIITNQKKNLFISRIRVKQIENSFQINKIAKLTVHKQIGKNNIS